MKILITGSKGMLGQELAKEFSENGCAVVAFSSSDLDITKEKDVEEKLKEINPDIVINAAAYNAVDKIEESGLDGGKRNFHPYFTFVCMMDIIYIPIFDAADFLRSS